MMRQAPLIATMLTTALASAVPAYAANLQRQVLPNGLTVIVDENRANPVVAIQVWVRVGSADERENEAGLAHVFEHMLFKGTSRRGVGEIARTIEAAGGDINAHTALDQTVYELSIPSDLFATGVDIMADAVFHSSFDVNELEREKEVILEEFKRGKDTPARAVMEGLMGTAFTTHPYRRPIIGYEETIRNLTRETLVDFFHRWYRPGNITVVVSGDVGHRDAFELIAKGFGEVPSGVAGTPERSPEPPQFQFRSIVKQKETQQVFCYLGFHIPGVRDPLSHRYDLLGQILGGGEGSRLYRALKERGNLVNSVWATAYTPLDPGLFIVGASFDTAVPIDQVLPALTTEIARLADDLTDEEVRRAIVNIESDFVYGRQRVEGEASLIGFFETIVGNIGEREAYLDLVRGVNREDLVALARNLFTPQGATISVVAPPAATIPGTPWFEGVLREKLQPAGGSSLSAGPDGPVETFTLANGMRVIVRPRSGVPMIAVRASLLGGLRFDPPGKEGLSNLCATTLTRGSVGFAREQVVGIMDETASSLTPFSGNNSFGISLTTLTRFVDTTLPVFLDALLRPSFPEEEFDKAKVETTRKLAARKEEKSTAAIDLLTRTLFTAHPYRFPSLGTEQSVAGIVRGDVTEFYRRYVRPDNLVLTVVGDVDPKRLRTTLEAAFTAWLPGSSDPTAVPVEPLPTERRSAEQLEPDLRQAHLAIGYPGPAIGDADRYAWEVLNAVLTGQGGRLFMELRDRQSLAYSVGSFVALGVDPGYLGLYLGLSPEKIPAAREGIATQIARLVDEPVGDEELGRAKRYLAGQHLISGQGYASVATELGYAQLYGLGLDAALAYPERILAVTSADVQRVARKYLGPGIFAEAVIKPKE